uniref:SH2 domain-containing protein n=2 Tax=Mesocestoides corti TaxID=53468 RepID=A0A5K3FUY0_MESCO
MAGHYHRMCCLSVAILRPAIVKGYVSHVDSSFGAVKPCVRSFRYHKRPRRHFNLKTILVSKKKSLQIKSRTLYLPPVGCVCSLGYECYAELLAQSGGGVGLATRLPPLANAPSTSLDPPTALSIARNKKDLEERDWYWGDISRSEVSEIMLGQPDGAFLVRDASAGSASAFTLTERRNFTTILFRIYHRGDVFDITNPPSPGFPLVSSLVAHYQQQGALTGVEVPTPRLLHPVTRRNFIDLPPSHLASAASSGQIVQGLLAALKNTSVELTRFQVQVSDVNRKLTELIHKMATTTNQMRALGLAQDWLVKTNYQFSRNQQALPGVSQDALAKYVSIFEKRLAWTRATRLEKRRQHNSLLDRTRQVSESQVVLCSKQHQVSRRMQEIRRELKRRGVSDEVIIAFDTVVTDGAPSQPPPPSTAVVPASDGHPTSLKRSDWFADVSRQLAESILSNKPSGTFLIRPSAVPNRFALSVRTGTSIQHCLIYCLHNRYGFSESSLPFLSLEELVAHYRVSSLAQHNALLDTTLTLPAFAPSSPP